MNPLKGRCQGHWARVGAAFQDRYSSFLFSACAVDYSMKFYKYAFTADPVDMLSELFH